MPWTARDAERHHQGLSAKQKRQWAHVANSQLQTCLEKGGAQSACEGQAIRAANAAVNKALDGAPLPPVSSAAVLRAEIAKADDSQQRLFGWVSIAVRKDGQSLVDLQGDVIDIEDLAEAWYDYVAESGSLTMMHAGPERGHLIEAMVFTPEKVAALGLAEGAVPLGAWAGYFVPDAHDYAVIKARGYFMFSIEGEAFREEIA
jgi:hypothetical protein